MTEEGQTPPDRRDFGRRVEDVHGLLALKQELVEVRTVMNDAFQRLVTHDDVEVRVRQAEILEAKGRHRFAAAVAVALVVVIALGGIMVIQVGATNRTTNRIEDCTIAGGKCYSRLVSNGQQGGVRIINFMKCALLIPINQRTDLLLEECKTKATATTPTTTGG